MIRQKNITSFILHKDIIINKGELNLYLIKLVNLEYLNY